MCLVWLNRSGVDATFYDAVEFDPMLTVTIGRNRPIADSDRKINLSPFRKENGRGCRI